MTGTLITVAPTGAEHRKADLPQLPVTLDELVGTARRCQDAGAGMIHVHLRDEHAEPTLDPGRLAESVAALRAETDLVVQLSTGGAVGDTEADRLAVLDAAPDSASCTLGSVDFGDEVFVNRWPFVVELHTRMVERGIRPEYEVFDIGQLWTLRRLLEEHGAPAGGHVHVDLVMGVPGGMPGDAATLVQAVGLLPAGATFSATGIGRTAIPVMLAALACGGHLRVGMEDTITFGRGRPVRDNAELVVRAAALAGLAQRPALDPGAARGLLAITTAPDHPLVG
jgi:uncharacterized protein (DUF849 family)